MTAYVATFYSFKGGVGRTTLLVNVANVLAARGERVLIWDLDLEAPGVHHFPGLEPPEPVWQSGFLEWLGQTPPCPTIEPTPSWPSDAWMRTLGDRVYETRDARGRIFVLPAHGTNANLGRAYGAIDWHGLFVDLPAHGLHLFSRVRDMLIDRFEPTFLFIDSRTGISDLGGFLTGFLPDCTILVGNYSRQSTEGLRGVYLALDRFATERVKSETHRTRKLERVLVASPVPSSLPARERGRKRWLDGFSGEAPRSLIEVPLVENLLYAEDVLVRSAPSSDAARAYGSVAEVLAGLRQVRERTEPALHAHVATLRGAERVERLLTLLGFELGKAAGSGGGLVVRQRTLPGVVTYRVEYIEGTARADGAFRDRLERLRVPPGPGVETLVIADAARDDARDAARAAGLALRTIAELEGELVDLRACAAAVRRMFEDSELSRVYVPPRVVTAEGRTVDGLAHAMHWVAGEGPRLLLVRGDPGSGKTGFLRRLAHELALRAEADPAAPTPILIELRQAAAGATLESLLQQQLRAAIGWHGNPEAILYLLHAGRVILLLDGFDEAAVSTREGAEEQLRLLTHPTERPGTTPSANRMIAACRAGHRVDGAGAMDLSPFDNEQVGRFLRNRFGRERGQAVHDRLLADAPTQTRSTPLFIQIITSDVAATAREGGAWPAEAGLRPAALLERHVEHWIAGEASDAVLPVQRARLVERLAAELWKVSAGELPHAQLVAAVRAGEPQLADLEADRLDLVLRSAPFVTRTEAGAYGFSHRSILDYMLARHLLGRARQGVDPLRAALTTEPLDDSCSALFAELAEPHPGVRDAVQQIAHGPYAAGATENAVRLAAALEARRAPGGGER